MRVFYLFFENKRKEISPGKSYNLGRGKDNDIVLKDVRVSRHHAVLLGKGDSFVLKDLNSTNGTWVEGERLVRELELRPGSEFRVGNCNCQFEVKETILETGKPEPSETMVFEGKISKILDEIKDPKLADKISELKNFYNNKKESLANLAYRDTLTGLYNRRYFDEKLEEERLRCSRYNRPLSLVMMDIDRFKAFNDTYGHQKGDEVLAGVAAILQETSRSMDILCRYGGEEMSFILPETKGDEAIVMAKLCCNRVECNSVELAGVKVTISLGVTQLRKEDKSIGDIIERADKALYSAKEGGRNQVCYS